MSNPVVLITGGLTGIGRAAAVAFAKKGAKVVVAGRRDEVGKTLAKELRGLGAEAEFINADVRKEEDVRALVDKTVARFGHRFRRSFIHHRPRPQRRWRQDRKLIRAAKGSQFNPLSYRPNSH